MTSQNVDRQMHSYNSRLVLMMHNHRQYLFKGAKAMLPHHECILLCLLQHCPRSTLALSDKTAPAASNTFVTTYSGCTQSAAKFSCRLKSLAGTLLTLQRL